MKKLASALVLSGILGACSYDSSSLPSGSRLVGDEKFLADTKLLTKRYEEMPRTFVGYSSRGSRRSYGPLTTSCRWSTWGDYKNGGSSMTCY